MRVLIGGLGLGYALDEALDLECAEVVTVAEFEPCILSWFERYGGERARRAAADGRARILIADVHDALREASCDWTSSTTSSAWTRTTDRDGWSASRTPPCTTTAGSRSCSRL